MNDEDAVTAPQITVRLATHRESATPLHITAEQRTVSWAKVHANADLIDTVAVHCGVVHSDSALLSDLHATAPDAPLVLVPTRAAQFPPVSVDALVLLHRTSGAPDGVDIDDEYEDPSLVNMAQVFQQFAAAPHPMWHPSTHEKAQLCAAVDVFRAPASADLGDRNVFLRAYEPYGCALLAHADHATVRLELVCLDGWEFEPRVGQRRDTQHVERARSMKVLPVGHIARNRFARLLQKAEDILVSGGGGGRGGGIGKNAPKTPGTIRAMLRQAIPLASGLPAVHARPTGGFTDVGSHPGGGGKERDTAFPLACAVLHAELTRRGCPTLCDRVLAQTRLALAEGVVNGLAQVRGGGDCGDGDDSGGGKTATALPMAEFVRAVDSVMHALRETCELVDRLFVCTALHDELGILSARVVVLRKRLADEMTLRSSAHAIDCRLPPLTDAAQRVSDFHVPVAPARPPRDGAVATAEMERMEQKLDEQFLCARKVGSGDWDALAAWLDVYKRRGFEHCVRICRTVERCVFDAAVGGLHNQVHAEVETIERVVDAYRAVLHEVYGDERSGAFMRVELRSRELLVTWIAFCAVHCAVQYDEPLVEQYDVPLDLNELRLLVLSEQHARDAVAAVATYLADHTRDREPIFSLHERDATIDFARLYAANSEVMLARWERECEEATERREARWAEVCAKKKRLAQLDSEMSRLHSDRTLQELKVIQNKRDNFAHARDYTRTQRELEGEQRELEHAIFAKRRSIADEEKAPPPILEPLPSTLHRAQPVLFFLWMPKRLEILARMSFAAQQRLLPHEDECALHIAPGTSEPHAFVYSNAPSVSWKDYYEQRSSAHVFQAHDVRVVLGSSADVVAGNWFPRSVRAQTSPSDGIWHPDTLTTELFWSGGGSRLDTRNARCFNPFHPLPERVRAHRFTERTAHGALHWAVCQAGASTTDHRSNEGVNAQNGAPDSLSRTQFVTFSSLRAYPCAQFRTLCCVLRDDALPLGQRDVATLLKMALFQVGELDLAAADVQFTWLRDAHGSGGWEFLRDVLQHKAEQLRFKVREHAELLVYAPVAAFAAQWDAGCAAVARDFASIAQGWADDLQQNEDCCGVDEVAELRARRCLFYLYALTCLNFDHDAGDTQQVCDLVVQAHYFRLFDEDSALRQAIARAAVCAMDAVCRRLDAVIADVLSNAPILTEAVQKVITSAPDCLEWNRSKLGGKGSRKLTSFYATCPDGHFYRVDLFTGQILFDGKPLSRLPATITAHKLYRQTFGSRNFEVVSLATGEYQSARAVDGRFYRFHSAAEDDVVISELEPGDEGGIESLPASTLELLPQWGTAAGDEEKHHATQLPLRVRHIYAHWLCRARNVILCRPHKFSERDVHFLLVEEAMDGAKWRCFRVPKHLRATPWPELLEVRASLDSLVQPVDDVMRAAIRVLSKFESLPGCIEVCRRADGTFVLQLPRFGLDFAIADDGSLQSTSYVGFKLARAQLVSDTLHGFTSYLLLESPASQKLLIPAGTVHKGESVCVAPVPDCAAVRDVLIFDMHPRFRTLDVQGGKHAVEGRLQLAAIFAASDSALPDARFARTAGETALHLLRGCWSSRPYSAAAVAQMQTVVRYGWRCPTLALLCYELNCSANALRFLGDTKSKVSLHDGAALRYVHAKNAGRLSSRMLLTSDEETTVFGHEVHDDTASLSVLPQVDVAGHKLDESILDETNLTLKGLLQWSAPDMTDSEYILPELSSPLSIVEADICAELRKSWDMYKKLKTGSLVTAADVMCTVIEDLRNRCRPELERTYASIVQALDFMPTAQALGNQFAAKRAANMRPTVHVVDIARFALDASLMRDFNPFLSEAALDALHTRTLHWLSLCVLDDKLGRMQFHAEAANSRELLRELEEQPREWSVERHPHWLLFEVEQQLSIRALQYEVAKFCLHNRHVTTQLNMGEGKTRVILPMLVLELAGKDHLVRLNFLPTLLPEAYDYLHRTLTAGLFAKRIALMPFCRDVDVKLHRVVALHEFLRRLHRSGGVLCVSPEHSLSFQLKWHELRLLDEQQTRPVRARMTDVMSMRYFDIMDEVDELLSQKYQLIYAVGDCLPLPAGKERWTAVQAVIRQLQSDDDALDLVRQCASLTEAGSASEMHAFMQIRLQPGDALDAVRNDLLSTVANAVLESPPYHMRHLRHLPRRADIVAFLVQRERSLQELRAALGDFEIPDAQLDMLLALRGLLAFGILEHCLTQRHRVDYGVDERRGLRHRVAVPYRASNVPSDRAEYAQPDTLIALTQLSYYYRGLSPREMVEAVTALLQLGPIAQASEYGTWVRAVGDAMTVDELASVGEATKLDVCNELQMALMHRVFTLNMDCINFWLDAVVLPRETMQFSKRMSANAFNLADNAAGNIVGFSGTKENRLLLPVQVEQRMPQVDEIRATDGKMLDLVLHDSDVRAMDGEADGALNMRVLRYLVVRKFNALLDAGALMAGLSNEQVALRIVQLLGSNATPHCFHGVSYFSQRDATWKVRSLDGMEWVRGSAPLHERDTVVYFDESRCRGSDMCLRDDARALLTVGPRMTKDKLMQAAGRLRKLGCDQTLSFIVPPELVAPICADDRDELTCAALLQWVIRNTAAAIVDGLPEWATQGMHFATTRDPRARVVDEAFGLHDLYAGAIATKSMCEHVGDIQRAHVQRVGGMGLRLDDAHEALCTRIGERARRVGADWHTAVVSLGEQCEREVENEREMERQVMREVPTHRPCADTGLGRVRLDTVRGMRDVQRRLRGTIHIAHAAGCYFRAAGLDAINWDSTELYATRNFLETVAAFEAPVDEAEEVGATVPEQLDLSEYMRPVGLAFVFPAEGSVLLISEHEADDALRDAWATPQAPCVPRNSSWVLVNATCLFAGDADPRDVMTWPLRVPHDIAFEDSCTMSEETMAGLQLFCGSTMFATQARIDAVRRLLASSEAKQAALKLVELRGNRHMLSRSDLEDICFS